MECITRTPDLSIFVLRPGEFRPRRFESFLTEPAAKRIAVIDDFNRPSAGPPDYDTSALLRIVSAADVATVQAGALAPTTPEFDAQARASRFALIVDTDQARIVSWLRFVGAVSPYVPVYTSVRPHEPRRSVARTLSCPEGETVH